VGVCAMGDREKVLLFFGKLYVIFYFCFHIS